jgi:uncharacterized protein (DUF1330 family)
MTGGDPEAAELRRDPIMPAYIVFTRLRTRNPEEIRRYSEQAADFLAGRRIKFLARFGRFEVKEGGGVEGVAILEFPGFDEAQAWYESPAYQSARQHRHGGADYSAIVVEGAGGP